MSKIPLLLGEIDTNLRLCCKGETNMNLDYDEHLLNSMNPCSSLDLVDNVLKYVSLAGCRMSG